MSDAEHEAGGPALAIPPDDSPGVGLLVETLARLPAQSILDEGRLAAVLGVHGRTVRRMVKRGELPPAVPLGGRSVWLAGRVLDYLDRQAERAEREAERAARRIAAYSP